MIILQQFIQRNDQGCSSLAVYYVLMLCSGSYYNVFAAGKEVLRLGVLKQFLNKHILN